MAKASLADMQAMFALACVLNSVDSDQFPCLPNGEWKDGDPDWFDETDTKHLAEFHRRLMGCIDSQPGCWNRVIWGFETLMTNGVCDPDKDTLQWHPDLLAAVNAREPKARPTFSEIPFSTNHTPAHS